MHVCVFYDVYVVAVNSDNCIDEMLAFVVSGFKCVWVCYNLFAARYVCQLNIHLAPQVADASYNFTGGPDSVTVVH